MRVQSVVAGVGLALMGALIVSVLVLDVGRLLPK
jgi:hypothetical protein